MVQNMPFCASILAPAVIFAKLAVMWPFPNPFCPTTTKDVRYNALFVTNFTGFFPMATGITTECFVPSVAPL